MKDENGDLLSDSCNILNRMKNYFQFLNIHRVSNVRQIKIKLSHYCLILVLLRLKLLFEVEKV
jgi:hypothetical protein